MERITINLTRDIITVLTDMSAEKQAGIIYRTMQATPAIRDARPEKPSRLRVSLSIIEDNEHHRLKLLTSHGLSDGEAAYVIKKFFSVYHDVYDMYKILDGIL